MINKKQKNQHLYGNINKDFEIGSKYSLLQTAGEHTEEEGRPAITLSLIDAGDKLPSIVGNYWQVYGKHGTIKAKNWTTLNDFRVKDSFVKITNFDFVNNTLEKLSDFYDRMHLESTLSDDSLLKKFFLVDGQDSYFFLKDINTGNVVTGVKCENETPDKDNYWRKEKSFTPFSEYKGEDKDNIIKLINNYIDNGGVLENSLSQKIVKKDQLAAETNKYNSLNPDGQDLANAFEALSAAGVTNTVINELEKLDNKKTTASIQVAKDKKSATVTDDNGKSVKINARQ